MKKNMLVVFGPADPEQVAAEPLVVAAGGAVAYACTLDADGRCVRVHPGNAYEATGYFLASDPLAYHGWPAWEDVTHLFECAPGDTSEYLAPDVIRLDHHRPGDAGYGRPPAEFLEASSIGQLVSYLAANGLWRGEPLSSSSHAPGSMNWDGSWWAVSAVGELRHFGGDPCPLARPTWGTIPADIVMVAAADHCLEAAYRGLCPGVSTDALMMHLWNVGLRDLTTLAAAIGKPTGAETYAFAARLAVLPTPDQVRMDPTGAPVPVDESALYLVALMLAMAATPQDVGPFCTYMARLPVIYGALLGRDMFRRLSTQYMCP